MTPIYKEYCQFLKDMTKNPPDELSQIQEGYFWLDNSIIKAFDKQGNEHKILRIKIDDNLEFIELKILSRGYTKLKDIDIASWEELLELHRERLLDLESKSIHLINDKLSKFSDYTPLIPVSTGKDSMVVEHLVRQVRSDTHAVFNNTTLDCADTYTMVRNIDNCSIMTPKEGFYQYIDRVKMIPNRLARFCCRIFKVGEMVKQLDKDTKYLMFLGMRNQESDGRSSYGDEWINTAEWGETAWQGILPIREWSELDIWLYTLMKGLLINNKYKKGYGRVGCAISCCYYVKSTWILDVYWYPVMRKRWEDKLKKDFVDNSKWLIMNCTINEYVREAWCGGTYRGEPTEEVIEEFAEYSELDIAVAKNYFNRSCANGCVNTKKAPLRIKDKETLAMNMKLYGRNISQFKCKKCIMKELSWTTAQWNEKVEDFKATGCKLF